MTIMIAFGHRKLVGKDTATRFLTTYLRMNRKNSNIQIRSFGYKLKLQCHELYSWAGLQHPDFYEIEGNQCLKDTILPALSMTPRDIWIKYGTHVCREIYADTWIDYLYRNLDCDICIIQDLRFVNEAEGIQNRGGYVYKIERDEAPNNSDVADDNLADFTSWNGIIKNNGTLKEFNAEIEKLGSDLLLQLPRK